MNCVSGKSAPSILSLKKEHTFYFIKFPIFGLCNSSARRDAEFWFNTILPLIAPPQVFAPADFFSKNLYTIQARPCWYLSYSGFSAILEALSPNTAFLGKSLKSQ